ncbi:12748_t:CDS:2 [Funneliformis caledonium]|uniref:12748_t:CDS:1 n=1 Tax=Funneliformis caledonium TaxID=1117310 RepID=A0A9N9IBJ1_9GLOM|nr:12748_t:CDS:2 [Funneliformis caledonium]
MQNNHTPTIIIIDGGPDGLLLYHGIQKHPWQGFAVSINSHGMRSLMSCLSESLVTRLPEVIPIPISEKENREILLSDDKGTELLRVDSAKVKSLFVLANVSNSNAYAFRDILRDLMLEGVNMQWGKKCIGYDGVNDEVWAIFKDGTREKGIY